MRALALILLTGCGAFIANDSLSGPYYDACMKRIGVDSSDREAHKVCVKRARMQAREAMQPDAEIVCVQSFGVTRCRYDDYR